MNDPDFRRFLEMCTTLNNEQREILRSALCEPPHQPCQLYERLEQNFSAHPRCRIATAKMFVNMVAKATANALNAKPVVVHSMS